MTVGGVAKIDTIEKVTIRLLLSGLWANEKLRSRAFMSSALLVIRQALTAAPRFRRVDHAWSLTAEDYIQVTLAQVVGGLNR